MVLDFVSNCLSSFSYIRLYPYWIAEDVPKIVCQEGLRYFFPFASVAGEKVSEDRLTGDSAQGMFST